MRIVILKDFLVRDLILIGKEDENVEEALLTETNINLQNMIRHHQTTETA